MLITFASRSPLIFAQQTPLPETTEVTITETTQEPAEGAIREQGTTAQEQTLLLTTYRGQLETYRAKEKTYQVAQEQLANLSTLAALEEAVQATKQVMVARDQVLQTYFKLLRLKLIDTHGVPLTDKTYALNELAELEKNLTTHEQEVNQVNDRFTLAQSSENFAYLADQFESATNRALCLITLGNLQTVFDRTSALIPEVETKITDKTTGFELAKKQRALTELKLLSTDTKAQLNTIYTQFFTTKDNQSKKFSNSDLVQLSTKLQPVYAQMNQMHQFIDEVTKI